MSVAALRRKIGQIDGAGCAGQPCLPLGLPEIDGALPGGGLRRGCVHEVGGDEAATGFCATVLARAGARGGALLWLAQHGDLHAPGLVRYGIEAGRLVVVEGLRRPGDVAWVMEEALRCRAVKGVVAESAPLGLAASRRLMLAAEGSDVVGLVLTPGTGVGSAGVPTAASRWRITAAPGRGPDREAWRVQLLHCRGGRPLERVVAWRPPGLGAGGATRNDAAQAWCGAGP